MARNSLRPLARSASSSLGSRGSCTPLQGCSWSYSQRFSRSPTLCFSGPGDVLTGWHLWLHKAKGRITLANSEGCQRRPFKVQSGLRRAQALPSTYAKSSRITLATRTTAGQAGADVSTQSPLEVLGRHRQSLATQRLCFCHVQEGKGGGTSCMYFAGFSATSRFRLPSR